MTQTHTLDDVESGELTADEADTVVAEALASTGAEEQVYVALRSWTWKAVNARRRDPDLAAWLDLLHRTRKRLEDTHPSLAVKTAALADLVGTSVDVATHLRPEELVRRKDVVRILGLLALADDAGPTAEAIGRKTGIARTNLLRLLEDMTAAKLVRPVRSNGDVRILLDDVLIRFVHEGDADRCGNPPETDEEPPAHEGRIVMTVTIARNSGTEDGTDGRRPRSED